MENFNLLNINNYNVGFDIDYTLTKDNDFYKKYIDNYININRKKSKDK